MAAAIHSEIRREARGLYTVLAQLPPSRERSLAMTKLEECIMWADKSPATPPIPPPLPSSPR